MEPRLYVSRHPLVQHKLTLLRNRTTDSKKFRELVREVSQLLFYETTADLRLERIEVETPLSHCIGCQIGEEMGLVPILRAGLGMVEAVCDIVPSAHVWHLGLYRDHETLQPVTYYNRLPARPYVDLCLVVDPMLATGGSAVATVTILKEWGAPRIKFMGLIASPEGVQALSKAHPDVPIHLAAVDERLNERGYIVPGLGDAGDRLFGTG